MRTSDKTSRLFGALAIVQQSCPLIEKSGTVEVDSIKSGHRVEKFAPHEEIQKKLIPLLAPNCLGYVQPIGIGTTGGPIVTTRITWTSVDNGESEWFESDAPVSPPKPGFRDYGAFVSYVRRIALLAAFGIVACGEDPDQGEAEKIKEAAPPRASKGSRPNHAPKDAESEAERIMADLESLPKGSTKAMVDELAAAMGAISKSIKHDTSDRARKAFADKRRELGLS